MTEDLITIGNQQINSRTMTQPSHQDMVQPSHQDMVPIVFKSGGQDFRLWQQKILFTLELRDLDDMVLSSIKISGATAAQRQQNKKAKASICSHLHDNVLHAVLQQAHQTAYEVWEF